MTHDPWETGERRALRALGTTEIMNEIIAKLIGL